MIRLMVLFPQVEDYPVYDGDTDTGDAVRHSGSDGSPRIKSLEFGLFHTRRIWLLHRREK